MHLRLLFFCVAVADFLQQYISHTLPFNDQIVGAAILQTTTRLGIPLGIGITTVIWSWSDPSPADPLTNFDIYSLDDLQAPYIHVFIATLAFAAFAVLLAPFTHIGKLGLPSTATNSSLPQADSGLKNINHDGPGDFSSMHGPRNQTKLTRLPSANRGNRLSQLFKIQPRRSSLQVGGTGSKNALHRSSAGANSFHLPGIAGFRASGDASGLGLGFSPDDDIKSQRTSTASSAMAGRVIWLVCEDCGASKRIVEPVGDPGKYFYDDDAICDGEDKTVKSGLARPLTPSPPSSVYPDTDASVADVGVVVDKRRFALVNAPMKRVMEVHEE